MKLSNYFKHLKVVCKHKYYVAKYCFKFGLYKQGILHDMSKFSPKEFLSSAKYYQGNKSPIEAEKDDIGYSKAWLHHFHNNPHHWMYWIDFDMDQNMVAYKIPYKYVIEAICDWIGAGIVYNKTKEKDFDFAEPYEYYKAHTRINDEISSKIFDLNTRFLFDIILVDLKEKGLEKVIKYHKMGTYKRMYEIDDVFNSDMIQVDYRRILNKYYKTKEERIAEFKRDEMEIHNRLVEVTGPFVKTVIVKPSFYNYLVELHVLDSEDDCWDIYDKYIIKRDDKSPNGYWFDIPVQIEKDMIENYKLEY